MWPLSPTNNLKEHAKFLFKPKHNINSEHLNFHGFNIYFVSNLKLGF